MSYTRSPEVEKIISRLKSKHETDTKGIANQEENARLMGIVERLLTGDEIFADERIYLNGYIELDRCLTVCEANRIASIKGRIEYKKTRRKLAGKAK